MGLDVGGVTMNFLPRPHGAAYDFAWSLVEWCESWGEGNAFGFYLREHLHQRAIEYIQGHPRIYIDPASQTAILDWVESLLYDDSGYITLHFNW